MLKTPASTIGGMGLIPGWGSKILHAIWQGEKKKNVNSKYLISYYVSLDN